MNRFVIALAIVLALAHPWLAVAALVALLGACAVLAVLIIRAARDRGYAHPWRTE